MKYNIKAVMLCSLLFLQIDSQAEEKREARHYIEANISTSYIFKNGDRLNNQSTTASGFHIAHGSNITPVHALVLSYGKEYLTNNNAILTSKALFLRRYIPKFSTPKFSWYFTIGSGTYTCEERGTSGVLENAGIIIGAGVDHRYTKNIRLSLETDYRGFTVKQFGTNAEDYIRPFTLFAGLKYYYSSSFY